MVWSKIKCKEAQYIRLNRMTSKLELDSYREGFVMIDECKIVSIIK